MTEEHDYYAVLGVPQDASAEQIRIARRTRLRETHPDVNPDDPKAAERFDFICKVCEVLGNPERRRMYDQELRGTTDKAVRDRVRCRRCGGSGAERFVKCGECKGLGRARMGFARECAECGGSGRVPEPCHSCEGRGWHAKAAAPKPPRRRTRTHYDVLGVEPDATAARITGHFRRLAGRGMVTDEMKAAYRHIGDPRRRGGYDRSLGLDPSPAPEIDVHVSRRVLLQGADQHGFMVTDRDLCPSCKGAGRIFLPCQTCQGRGYWQYGSSAPSKCDTCHGRGSDDWPCTNCADSGWVRVTRRIQGRVPSGTANRALITVSDDLLGTITLRLHLALVPGFAREE